MTDDRHDRTEQPTGDVVPGANLRPPAVDRLLLALTGLAVAAGVVLRFLPRHGMWLDEALTANISSLPLGELSDALRRDGHPPLYYALSHVWMQVVGDSDWAARALAGVISVLGLPLAYLAGCRLAERRGAGPLGVRRTGFLALAVMAMLPYGIRYGAENRMYSLVVTLALAGYLLADDLLSARSPGRRPLVAAAAALVAAALLWSHYWSMWLLAAVGLVALWRAWRDRDPARRTGARWLVGALVVGGLLFLPWLPVLLHQTANTGTPWGTRFGPASVVVISIVDFAGARFGAAQLLTYLLVPLILLASTAHIVARRTMPRAEDETGVDPDQPHQWDSLVVDRAVAPRIRNELLIMGLALGLGWATAFASNNTFASRYAAVVYPLFVLCVAAGIAMFRQGWLTNVVLAVVLAGSAFGAVGEVSFERSQTEPLTELLLTDLATARADGATTPPVVVACPDQIGVALQRELDHQSDEQLDVVPFPTMGDPRFVDWVDYGERNEAADPGAFAQELMADVPADATVYVVSNANYRTFESKCEQLIGALSAGRDLEQLESSKPDDHDEIADLLVLRPRA